MRILSIETSCDETAVSIIDATGDLKNPQFKVLANSVVSQIMIHREYGGVFPMLAKREHQKNLIPLLKKTLAEAEMNIEATEVIPQDSPIRMNVRMILEREPELRNNFEKEVFALGKPAIDLIAVTSGPGLEPALWVGINFAKALSVAWDLPILPVNHMEGHIISILVDSADTAPIQFPALALLISGGHTELVLMHDWHSYKIVGATRDDAVGEAFDKAARILSLPYPGGPEISRLAEKERSLTPDVKGYPTSGVGKFKLPRPMIDSPNLDFSFSGLKTAVLYTVKKIENITEQNKQAIAKEFEDAVTEVLVAKTKKALDEYGAETLILGGGVVANKHIRESFALMVKDYPQTTLRIPEHHLSTDNALMIGAAAYTRVLANPKALEEKDLKFKAEGNMTLA